MPELSRGREAHCSDERVLGSSAFVEALMEELEAEPDSKGAAVDLDRLARRIARDEGVPEEAIHRGGRTRSVVRARSLLCHVWVRALGRNGSELAKWLGITPQAVSISANRVERSGAPDDDQVRRWCR